MSQTPTVVRNVHYYQANAGPGAAPTAALITTVHSDSCVSLCVFPHGAAPEPHTSVLYSEEPTPNERWCWPPQA